MAALPATPPVQRGLQFESLLEQPVTPVANIPAADRPHVLDSIPEIRRDAETNRLYCFFPQTPPQGVDKKQIRAYASTILRNCLKDWLPRLPLAARTIQQVRDTDPLVEDLTNAVRAYFFRALGATRIEPTPTHFTTQQKLCLSSLGTAVRRYFQNSIRGTLDRWPCYLHAFLQTGDARGILHLWAVQYQGSPFPDATLKRRLSDLGYHIVTTPQPGDLVLYCKDEDPKHLAVATDEGRVISKFGQFPFCTTHPQDLVFHTYGTPEYYRLPHPPPSCANLQRVIENLNGQYRKPS